LVCEVVVFGWLCVDGSLTVPPQGLLHSCDRFLEVSQSSSKASLFLNVRSWLCRRDTNNSVMHSTPSTANAIANASQDETYLNESVDEGNTVFWESFFRDAGFVESTAKLYASIFKKHEIEADMIPDLSHEVLLQMGITKAGHRIKILRMQRKRLLDVEDAKTTDTDSVLTFKDDWDDSERHTPQTEPIPTPLPKICTPRPNSAVVSRTLPNNPKILISQRTERSGPHATLSPDNPSPPTRHVFNQPTAKRIQESRWKQGAIARPFSSFTNLSQFPSNLQDEEIGVKKRDSSPHNTVCAVTLAGTSAPRVGINYFLNDDFVKHKLTPDDHVNTIGAFTNLITQRHNLKSDFAVFSVDSSDPKKLRVLKDDQSLSEGETYYVIENAKLEKVSQKIERKAKKDTTASLVKGGRIVFTSDNYPIKVDFIPDSELYMNQMGRLGMCMAPGRKKKKKNHDWDRDLSKDLDIIKQTYKGDVIVSLIRHSEMRELQIANLFREIEARDMESIHFPIKDKWIPPSMEGLIYLVDIIIERMKSGKAVICHCNGGKGRTGTVVVATLVGLGKKVQHAIDVTRKARPGTIRNPVQIMYVKRFKAAWRAYKKKQRQLEWTPSYDSESLSDSLSQQYIDSEIDSDDVDSEEFNGVIGTKESSTPLPDRTKNRSPQNSEGGTRTPPITMESEDLSNEDKKRRNESRMKRKEVNKKQIEGNKKYKSSTRESGSRQLDKEKRTREEKKKARKVQEEEKHQKKDEKKLKEKDEKEKQKEEKEKEERDKKEKHDSGSVVSTEKKGTFTLATETTPPHSLKLSTTRPNKSNSTEIEESTKRTTESVLTVPTESPSQQNILSPKKKRKTNK